MKKTKIFLFAFFVIAIFTTATLMVLLYLNPQKKYAGTPQQTTSIKKPSPTITEPKLKVIGKTVIDEDDMVTLQDGTRRLKENERGFHLKFYLKNTTTEPQKIPKEIRFTASYEYSNGRISGEDLRLINFKQESLAPSEEIVAKVSKCEKIKTAWDAEFETELCDPGYDGLHPLFVGKPLTRVQLRQGENVSEIELPRENGLTPEEARDKSFCDDIRSVIDKDGNFDVKIGSGDDAYIQTFNIKQYDC